MALKSPSGTSAIGILWDNTPYFCITDKSGNTQLTATTFNMEHSENLISIEEGSGTTRLISNGNYVCANRRGDLAFDKQSASHWEAFRIQAAQRA
jgi:hypothetical protein